MSQKKRFDVDAWLASLPAPPDDTREILTEVLRWLTPERWDPRGGWKDTLGATTLCPECVTRTDLLGAVVLVVRTRIDLRAEDQPIGRSFRALGQTCEALGVPGVVVFQGSQTTYADVRALIELTLEAEAAKG